MTIPSVQTEVARDLVRAREDDRDDLMRERRCVSKLLLRHEIVYSGGKPWTGAHDLRLRRQTFDSPTVQVAFDAVYEAMILTVDRRNRLDEHTAKIAAVSEFTPVVRRLGCLRGVSTLTAFGLAVEIGDWTRFTGSSIGAYVGLVPSEYSSGASRSQGSITKTGNDHARRLLVEAAWHHRKTYRSPGQIMRERWALALTEARLCGHEGNRRRRCRPHVRSSDQAPWGLLSESKEEPRTDPGSLRPHQ